MDRRNRVIDRRSRCLVQGTRGDGPVIYWMERDQRAADNWALLWAQQEALVRRKSLLVVYCYDPFREEISPRQKLFGSGGLAELHKRFSDVDIGFGLLEGDPARIIPETVSSYDAHLLVTDFNPLRYKQNLIKKVKRTLQVPFFEVDSHNIIPAWILSDKREYAAYTIRPKVKRLLDDYLTDFPALSTHPYPFRAAIPGFEPNQPLSFADQGEMVEVDWLTPGEQAARAAMKRALSSYLPVYDTLRNDPNAQAQSGLSPFLHFGQLSAQRLAWEVSRSDLSETVREDFLEELIVRRELADNYCLYEPNYDLFEGFTDWARKTLNEHRGDSRAFLYSREQFEQAETHEPLWNACQQELVIRGKLHGYLRMYWAKKILEWTASPEQALDFALYLNDHYSLDGCDPNGYTGVAWSIGGVHDRAWREREVFGKIRYMNEAGCRRKFDVDEYIKTVPSLT